MVPARPSTPGERPYSLPSPLPLDHPRIRKIAEHVSANPAAHLSLADAARLVNISSKHLCAFFRERVGINFGYWQGAVRIQNARQLLLTESLPAWVVGRRVGYENPDTFARAFKRYEGVSPRQFKNAIRTYPMLKIVLRSSALPATVLFNIHAISRSDRRMLSALRRLSFRLHVLEGRNPRPSA